MIKSLFAVVEKCTDWLWGPVGMVMILGGGAIMSHQLGWVQVRALPTILRTAWRVLTTSAQGGQRGVAPAQTFFASLGGCVGVGNLVAVATAVRLAGPGVLVWVWVVALLGMALKYAEVHAGMAYRRPNQQGSYDGGPMYVLPHAFPRFKRWLPQLVAFLLCVYGAEIYIFTTIKEAVVTSWSLPDVGVSAALLALIILGVRGGVRRIGAISSVIIPLYGVAFLGMTLWVVLRHAGQLPSVLAQVLRSAFCGHEAVGNFAGSTLILTVRWGLSAACYSGDVGIGYASIIHSESQAQDPGRQASLSILDILLDTAVCTCVVFILLLTDTWHHADTPAAVLVQQALADHFPYMHVFMPSFLFCLGYTTILAYLIAGLKSTQFLNPAHGKTVYWLYGVSAFAVFSVIDSSAALNVMLLAGGLLLVINISALLRLRKSVHAPGLLQTPPN